MPTKRTIPEKDYSKHLPPEYMRHPVPKEIKDLCVMCTMFGIIIGGAIIYAVFTAFGG